jgi:hypothetical protein
LQEAVEQSNNPSHSLLIAANFSYFPFVRDDTESENLEEAKKTPIPFSGDGVVERMLVEF